MHPESARWTRWRTATVVVALGLVLAVGGTALAGKPEKDPKPPPTPVDGGTIYISNWSLHTNGSVVDYDWSLEVDADLDHWINPDGSGFDERPRGMPSQALHNGKRWYLQLRKYPYGAMDATPPTSGDWDPEAYPQFHICGTRRVELFAVREDDGYAIQLTNDPTIRFNDPEYYGDMPYESGAAWAVRDGVADGKISFLGVRWNASAQYGPRPQPSLANPVPDEYEVLESGLYVVDLDWQSGVPLPINEPTLIDVGDRTAMDGKYGMDPGRGSGGRLYVRYLWSPDGESLVFQNWMPWHEEYTDYYTPPADQIGNSKYPSYTPDTTYPGLWRLDTATSWAQPV